MTTATLSHRARGSLRFPHRRPDGMAQAPHGPFHLVPRSRLRGRLIGLAMLVAAM